MSSKRERRWEGKIQLASEVIYESESTRLEAPQINSPLRSHALTVPEQIMACSGIVIFGKRIRSLVYTTDIAIIRNVNADAIFAVYPFTPQPIISQMLIHAADVPVFAGIGGGTTQGKRVVHMGQFAEMQGAFGVVVNAPTQNSIVEELRDTLDIPVIVTCVNTEGIKDRLLYGASILSVAAGARTPQVVSGIRAINRHIPIIATGGPTGDSITATIEAGANAIIWTPPSSGDVCEELMEKYRRPAND